MEASSHYSQPCAWNGSECVRTTFVHPFFSSSSKMLFFSAHFSENWGYLSLSPMAGGNLFSIVFGRNLDKHDVTNTIGQAPIAKAAPFAAPQCLLGLECYVDTLYLTAGATFLAMLLSIWAGYRDRRKIAASREKEFSRRGGDPWEYDEERRGMIDDAS
jgi:hypothetical protein